MTAVVVIGLALIAVSALVAAAATRARPDRANRDQTEPRDASNAARPLGSPPKRIGETTVPESYYILALAIALCLSVYVHARRARDAGHRLDALEFLNVRHEEELVRQKEEQRNQGAAIEILCKSIVVRAHPAASPPEPPPVPKLGLADDEDEEQTTVAPSPLGEPSPASRAS
jgi:hypothetical protein